MKNIITHRYGWFDAYERDLKILAAVTVMMVSYYALAGEMHRNILNLLNRRREDKWQ